MAYAITIHNSQGSEFESVIIPVITQHFGMLFRNLIYTGITRAKKLAVLVETRKALALAVNKQGTVARQTALAYLLKQDVAYYMEPSKLFWTLLGLDGSATGVLFSVLNMCYQLVNWFLFQQDLIYMLLFRMPIPQLRFD
ncbi:hypothetical protein GCM10027443_07580 [Pontibacter brevis]